MILLSNIFASMSFDISPEFQNLSRREYTNPFASVRCFHLLSLPTGYVSGYANFPAFLEHMFTSIAYRVTHLGPSQWTARDLRITNFLDPRHTYHPIGFQYNNKTQTLLQLQSSVERELLKCGKSVYISDSDVIRAELNFLGKYFPSKRFYTGKQNFESPLVTFTWRMTVDCVSKVPKHFKSVVESGLYRRLEMEELHQRYLHRKPVNVEEVDGAIRLRGAILTLFIQCGGVILLAVFVLVLENRLLIVVIILNIPKCSRCLMLKCLRAVGA